MTLGNRSDTTLPNSTLARDVRRRLQQHKADLIQFASELIALPSENPPGNAYPECGRLIAQWLRDFGLRVRTANASGSAPNVIGTWGGDGPALYFSGHYDVVPAQSTSQFTPAVRKANLHGRGAADMKGGIAAMASAIRVLRDCGFEPKGRIVSMSVPDEETSGSRGTVALAKAGQLERDAIGMLTMEPTSGVVWNASRGVVTMRVTVRGRPAHVGLHFRGVNAFDGMLDVAGRLRALRETVSERQTAFTIEPEAARRSVLLLGGELAGGHSFNVVPELASFTVDRRINPEEDFEVEREMLLHVVQEARSQGIDCHADIFQEGRAGATDPNGQLGQALSASIRHVTKKSARVELCPGVLETRHYAALGIPALAYGPGLLSVAHGPHEFVSVSRLLQCAEVYALAAVNLLS